MARNHPENVNPHIGQISFQRDDGLPPAMADYFGGGGCPGTTDVLVPDLPFDFLQPQMRNQVTQVGYGGPFVIRSNPIGAFVDAVRGFCSPVPMEQTSADGGVYSDLSGNDLGSYGDPTSAFPGGSGYTGFGNQGAPRPAPMTCGTGTMWDASMQLCVPTPGMAALPLPVADGCDYASLVAEGAKLGVAKATNDVRATCGVIGKAESCIAAAGANETLRKQWTDLKAAAVKQANDQTKNQGCAAWINAHPSGAPPPAPTPGMPPPAGAPPPAAGGSPGTDNSGMNGGAPAAGSGTKPANDPFGYIGIANPVYSLLPTRTMPRLPQMPDPGSMTEGNIYLMPTAEPFGGSFDPMKSEPARRPGRAITSRGMMNATRGQVR